MADALGDIAAVFWRSLANVEKAAENPEHVVLHVVRSEAEAASQAGKRLANELTRRGPERPSEAHLDPPGSGGLEGAATPTSGHDMGALATPDLLHRLEALFEIGAGARCAVCRKLKPTNKEEENA